MLGTQNTVLRSTRIKGNFQNTLLLTWIHVYFQSNAKCGRWASKWSYQRLYGSHNGYLLDKSKIKVPAEPVLRELFPGLQKAGICDGLAHLCENRGREANALCPSSLGPSYHLEC